MAEFKLHNRNTHETIHLKNLSYYEAQMLADLAQGSWAHADWDWASYDVYPPREQHWKVERVNT